MTQTPAGRWAWTYRQGMQGGNPTNESLGWRFRQPDGTYLMRDPAGSTAPAGEYSQGAQGWEFTHNGSFDSSIDHLRNTWGPQRVAGAPAAQAATAPAARPTAAPAVPISQARQQPAAPAPTMQPPMQQASPAVAVAQPEQRPSLMQLPAEQPAVVQPPVAAPSVVQPGAGLNTEGMTADPRYAPDLETRRRAAFLGASDSMAGLKAVRGVLGDELRNLGGDPAAGGSIPSIRFLEGEIAKRREAAAGVVPVGQLSQADQDVWKQMAFEGQPIGKVQRGRGPVPVGQLPENDQGVWGQMAFEGQPIAMVQRGPMLQPAAMPGAQAGATAVPVGQLSQADQDVWKQMAFEGQPITAVQRGQSAGPGARSGAATLMAAPAINPEAMTTQQGRATVDAYLQDVVRKRASASSQPLNEVATWQTVNQPITAARTDPGREAMLAAFAATGETPPASAGEALLAAGAGNAFGTRGGQFKPGNTFNLGFMDPELLKRAGLNRTGFYSGVNLGFNPGNGFS